VSASTYRIEISYGYWNVYQEVIAVSSGPFGCTLIFGILMLLTWIGHRYIEYFPKLIAKFVVWFAIGSMGDGFMIAVVDVATRNYSGDLFKLPNYYYKAESSTIAGYIVAVVVYIFFIVVNLMMFYNYIIYLHLNGRLQDIYARLLGDPKVFFIPGDNEISLRHLLWCYYNAIVNSQRIVVNKMNIINEYGENRPVTTLQTSEYLTDVSLSIKRTFVRDDNGCIKELTEKEISYLNAKEYLTLTQMLNKVSTNKSREYYEQIGGAEKLNAGLENIDAANPYVQEMNQFNMDLKSEKSVFNKFSLPKRLGTKMSSRPQRIHSGMKSGRSTMKSVAMSRKSGRRNSVRSKKSHGSGSNSIINKSKSLNKRSIKRRPTYIRRSSKMSLKKNITAQNLNNSELIDNSMKLKKIRTIKKIL